MKKKIISLLLVVILLLTHSSLVIAATTESTFVRNEAEDQYIKDKAQVIGNTDRYLDGTYNANTLFVPTSSVKIYKYGTTEETEIQGTVVGKNNIEETYTQNKGYLNFENGTAEYCIKLASGEQHYDQVATVLYKNALKYDGKKYDIQMNIKRIDKYEKEGETTTPVFYINRANSKENELEGKDEKDLSNYTGNLGPAIGIAYGLNSKVDVTTEYILLEKGSYEAGDPKKVKVSGLFGFMDLDFASGFFVEGATVRTGEHPTVFTTQETVDKDDGGEVGIKNVRYRKMTINNIAGTFFYESQALNSDNGVFYFLMEDVDHVNFVKTYDYETQGETSGIRFVDGDLKRYHYIKAEVEGPGVIKNNSSELNKLVDESNVTILYEPSTIAAYLVSIIVDGEEKSIDEYENGYLFSNIKEDHTIKVVYANKYKVTFNTHDGLPQPDKQYVKPNEKAIEPVTDPAKKGYTFEGWGLDPNNKTEKYNFNTPVTSDVVLHALWNPYNYKINYVLDGGTNNTQNPSSYTIADTVTFKNPTKPGYVFKGWYEDSGLQTKIVEIPEGSTGDKTVYAKWEEADSNYDIEYYKNNKSSQYTLAVSETKQAKTNATVTIPEKTFVGYKENETHEDRKIEGKITPGNDLVLKRFYDLINYNIEYVLNGGVNDSTNPSTYTVEDNYTFKPATRQGYDFKGWYEDPNFTNELNGTAGKTGNIKVYAKWEAKDDTKYKVEHYLETKNGNYELQVTDNLTGTTGEEVTATPKSFDGYVENKTHQARIPSGTIEADESLVLKLYYDNIRYKINYVLNGGTNDSRNPSTYTIDETIDLEPATRPGYDFTGWYENENLTNPITTITDRQEDITVYAGWKKQEAKYTVEHYKEVKGGKYELATTEEFTGITGSEVEATANKYKGYHENTEHKERVEKGTISGDGKLVLKLYYERDKFKVTFDAKNDEKIDDQMVPYLETVTKPTDPKKTGYEFEHWYYINSEGKKVVYDFEKPVTEDIDLIAEWIESKVEEPKQETPKTPEKDTTVAKTPIPQTGLSPMILFAMIAIIVVACVLGKKYLKYKDI